MSDSGLPHVTPAKRSSSSTRSTRSSPYVHDFGDNLVANLQRISPAVQKLDSSHRYDKNKPQIQWNSAKLNHGPASKKVRIETVEALKPPLPPKQPPQPVPIEVTKETNKIPDATRSLIENKGLHDLVCDNLICRKCKRVGSLELTFNTVCVTTIPRLSCSRCNWEKDAVVSTTSLVNKTAQKTIVQYETNVRFGLAFVASGDGGTEAQRFLATMSLPNATSMKRSSLPKIERAMTDAIQEITDDNLTNNLIKEVRRTYEHDMSFDFLTWKECILTGEDLPPGFVRPLITTAMDMGWNKRSSGRKYDSNSGHAFLVGALTRKPVAKSLKSKFCSVCSWHMTRRNLTLETVPEHECLVNHEGSSGSMESAALIEMAEHLFFRQFVSLKAVITDDDSKMKANCKWSNHDWLVHRGLDPDDKEPLLRGWRQPKDQTKPKVAVYRKSGLLRYPVHQPEFLADPAHRKKTLRNRLYALKSKGVEKSHGLEDGDILRLTMYFIYFVRQLNKIPEDEWETKAWAVLDHHFDSHSRCGDWCKRQHESEEDRTKSGKSYRSIVDHADLYAKLKEILTPFVTMKGLKELSHGSDTNVNESLNNTISWFAPKNKTYCGSDSLRNRVGMAISIHLTGYDTFFFRLFDQLGLIKDDLMVYCFVQREQQRAKQLLVSRTAKHKKKRRDHVYQKLRAYFQKLAEDKAKDTAYQTGSAMDNQLGTDTII